MPATDPWSRVASPCFVSHSYRDADAVEALQQRLPANVDVQIFGRVEPDPASAVSDGVIPRIRDCKSLIYLRGGASESSFWVSFERDYAHRAGLQVLAYDPVRESLYPDESKPVDLAVKTLYHPEDRSRVDALAEWMSSRRNFELDVSTAKGRLGGIRADDALTMQDLLAEGGVLLWFAGAYSQKFIEQFRKPGFGQHETEFQPRIAAMRLEGTGDALAELAPLNEYNDEFYYMTDPYYFVSDLHVRIDPALAPAWEPPGAEVIDVLTGADGVDDFHWNRVDDLIIRLYAALATQRKRRAGSPPATRAALASQLEMLVQFWEEQPTAYGRVRLGSGKRPYARWMLSIAEAQHVLDHAARQLYGRYGGPTQVSRLTHPQYPFEDDFPAHFTLVWPQKGSAFELSMELDGHQSAVYLRHLTLPE